MKLKFHNSPEPEKFATDLLPKELPAFLTYEPDWQKMEAAVLKYSHIKNILVIAHGGSLTGFYGLYESLKSLATKKAYFLQTVDPDYIHELKLVLSPEDTLVIPISKSGENSTQIEAFLQFQEYPLLFVTGEGSPLYHIAETLGKDIFIHPVIGGRYTGFTEVLLLPALLCGLPAKEFFEGGREVHKTFSLQNDAWHMASVFWQLEKKGFVDVFMPFYSHYLFPWNLVIVQLCHESFGKDGKGGTYLAFEAPESQHHTNQRFFGGIKNMAGLFLGVESFTNKLQTHVTQNLANITFKSESVKTLDTIPLDQSLRFELEGTLEDASGQGTPCVSLTLPKVESRSVGEFLAFWQLYAVYSSLLRNVDPFDQPQVEASKALSFQKRQSYKPTTQQ